MASPTRSESGPPLVTLSLLFFVSGATALSAEVVLNKLLTYVFGSSHLATSTVLAAYMAGLSAGAWVFGRAASRLRRPVLAYAALELLVGAFYALLPLLFGPFQRASVALQSPLAGSPALLTAVRFALCFALVFAPTLLMGGTLPTLVSAFHRGAALRRSLPLLYATNTLGAAAGTLLASYSTILRLGLDGTLFVCAGLNVVVALAAVLVGRGLPPRDAAEETASDAIEPAADVGGNLAPHMVYLLAFAQGTLSFVLEVVWSHLIGTVIGVTSYAFALMLFAILLGIGLGSFIVPRLTHRRAPAAVFAAAMTFLALGVALSLRGWDQFANVVGFTKSLASPGHFYGREGVRLAFCLVLLFPPALAMGISLPALAASARGEGPNHGQWVGRVFASNTLGTITGSLLCGFVLLGRLRSETILTIVVAAALALAFTALALADDRARTSPRGRIGLAAFAVLALGLALGFKGFDAERLTLGTHYYWWVPSPADRDRVTSLREDAQNGFITVSTAKSGVKTLKTNGKYEGTDAAGEFQDLFALFGSIYVKRWDRAALVGIGPSRTLRVLYEMPFQHIEAVEYSPAMMEAAYREFPDFAKVPFDDKNRVSIFCDDGRNHLQLSRDTYDYIAVAITGAAFAGSSNVYSQDFFRAIDAHLSPEGVFMLWIQVHHVFPEDVRSVVYTLRSVFPHVHMYTDAGQTQGFLLASRADLTINPRMVEEKLGSARLHRTIQGHGLGWMLDLTERSVFTTDAELTRYFTDPRPGHPPVLLTDLRPTFEYKTPFGLSSAVYHYDFQAHSDKRLPRFDPPLSPPLQKVLEARRLCVVHEYEQALSLFQEAKALAHSSEWDAQIAWVTQRIAEQKGP
ncbi:Spermidine synthase [Minicystis rosea]|nr:Spermidine synthase [Minicystis rosea]